MSRGTNGYSHFQALRLGGPVAGEPKGTDRLTGAGAINPDTLVTELVTSAADAFTLADGEVQGQIKIITMLDQAAGDGTLTPANMTGGTTITFGDNGDSVILMFLGTTWRVIGNNGAVLA